MEVPIKHFCCTSSTMVVLRKNGCTIFELPIFFTDTTYTWQTTDTKLSYTDTGMWHIFSGKWTVKLSFQGKQLTIFTANDKIWAFEQVLGFMITCIHHCEPDSFSKFKGFSDETGHVLNIVSFFILYNKIGQHLKELLNSINLYFSNCSMHGDKNYAWVSNSNIGF